MSEASKSKQDRQPRRNPVRKLIGAGALAASLALGGVGAGASSSEKPSHEPIEVSTGRDDTPKAPAEAIVPIDAALLAQVAEEAAITSAEELRIAQEEADKLSDEDPDQAGLEPGLEPEPVNDTDIGTAASAVNNGDGTFTPYVDGVPGDPQPMPPVTPEVTP